MHEITKQIHLNNRYDNINNDYFENKSIQKAILLLNYVKICKSWIGDKYNENDKLLSYIKNKFIPYFQNEIDKIGDKDLYQEMEILNKIVLISKSADKDICDAICNNISKKDKNNNSMKQIILTYNPLQCILTNKYIIKDIIHPIDIYHTAFSNDFIYTNNDILSILPNYGLSPCPFKAIYDLSKSNKKHTIILIPIYVKLNKNFILEKCNLIANDFEALNQRGIMFYYHGLIFAINRRNLNDKTMINDELSSIQLLENNMNIDNDSSSSSSELIKSPFLRLNCIDKWLNVGCGSIFVHFKSGYTINAEKYVIKNYADYKNQDENEDKSKQQIHKLLFLCNVEAEIYYHVKELQTKLKNGAIIPLTISKQIAMNKSIMMKRIKVLNEYYKQREQELNDYDENKLKLGQKINDNEAFAYKMAGYQ